MGVQNLHQWAIGRPYLVAIPSLHLAAMTTFGCELLDMIRTGKAARAVPKRPTDEEWLSIYRDPRRLKRSVQATFWPPGGAGVHEDFAEVARWVKPTTPQASQVAQGLLKNAPPHLKAEGKSLMVELIRQGYRAYLVEISEMLADVESVRGVNMDRAMEVPEAQFFLLVLIPSMIEYGESPMRIYRRARKGDRAALDQLIRLDKAVIRDPAIKRHIEAIADNRDKYGGELVGKALAGGAETGLDARSMKIRAAAQIMMRASQSGYDLNYQDVRDLFDALARDIKQNARINDPHLQDDLAAFKKSVQRAKAELNMPYVRDKTERQWCPDEYGWVP